LEPFSGRDGNPRELVARTSMSLMSQLWLRVCGTPFDCSAMLLCSPLCWITRIGFPMHGIAIHCSQARDDARLEEWAMGGFLGDSESRLANKPANKLRMAHCLS
jgi:hypothetical protein